MAITRCINLDWLEVHCLEPANATLDAAYFASKGWHVVQRDYGTRTYEEMFTLFDWAIDQPIIEVRRKPVTNKSAIKHVIDPKSCHLRLSNRTCYYEQAAQLMADFITRHGYEFRRISRVDVCLDFERFDSGDDPQRFLMRYLQHRYSKINQCDLAARGKDLWDGRNWNYLAWGAPKSMISTKFYNKTLELKQKKDKPYIRQAWASCGLVDDFISLTKRKPDGTTYEPQIWRVEFSIQSSVKKWYVIEDYNGDRKRILSKHNTLDIYTTRPQLLEVFASLAHHYFHFKKFRDGVRKDRCEDKVLFRFAEQAQYYKVEHVASATPKNRQDEALLLKLEAYKMLHHDTDIQQACNTLIAALRESAVRDAACNRWNTTEVDLLRLLISKRIKENPKLPLDDDLRTIQALLQIDEKPI